MTKKMSGLGLFINGCLGSTSVALLSWPKGQAASVLASKFDGHQNSQAEVLAPMVADILVENNLAAADISWVFTLKGPGSFNGVRASLAFSRAFCLATGAIFWGMDSLAALSLWAPNAAPTNIDQTNIYQTDVAENRAVILHMAGAFFVAGYDNGPMSGAPILPSMMVSNEEMALNEIGAAFGANAPKKLIRFGSQYGQTHPSDQLDLSQIEAFARRIFTAEMVWDNPPPTLADNEPLYLRGADAIKKPLPNWVRAADA